MNRPRPRPPVQADWLSWSWRRRSALIAAAAVAFLAGCTTLDRKVARTPSAAISEAESDSTTLGRAWTAAAPTDPALSAFRLLPNSLEAFAARVAMIDAAERTIDLQTYIFKNDDIGLFLVDRLVTAADRGVRVRILIDDMEAHGVEQGLATFDGHPNIELRLYNPWTQRGFGRWLEFLYEPHLNHRMHNKLFIADGIVSILGGRNLADEYFDLHAEYDFRDFDVLTAGPVVAGANRIFDQFWNGPDAIPVTGLKPRPDTEKLLEEGRTRLADHRAKMQDSAYAAAVRGTDFVQQLQSHSIQWVFAKGQVLGDVPDALQSKDDAAAPSLTDQLRTTFFSARKDLLVCTPYFVPWKDATKRLGDLAAGGTDVRIITNSLATNDQGIVHAWYKKYRKELLERGVQLFELRRVGANVSEQEQNDRDYGSANSALHAKTFVVDRQQVFIGSLNLDPRSVIINTEIGVLIDSPELSEGVAEKITMLMSPAWSYRLVVNDKGKLEWIGVDARGVETRFDVDPDTTGWTRFKNGLLGWLPVEGQI